ncbi:hypothetical protein HaLaN_28955 [Haematococcus lacustris]|uniref:Uncharacterized protein n=1 Tax=Haematococcus lacustris TaxID=44745 RepID=A0A6A0ABW7_HAELA|nr:hypothetical protein HaLaN_28955 [Haematococcus lacustris]
MPLEALCLGLGWHTTPRTRQAGSLSPLAISSLLAYWCCVSGHGLRTDSGSGASGSSCGGQGDRCLQVIGHGAAAVARGADLRCVFVEQHQPQ